MSDSLQPNGLQPTRILCPWGFPGKTTAMLAISFSRGSSQSRNRTHVSWIGRRILYLWATRETNNSRVLGEKEVNFRFWEWGAGRECWRQLGERLGPLPQRPLFIFHIRLEKAPFDGFLSDLKLSPFLKIPIWKCEHSTACAVLWLVTHSCSAFWGARECSPPGFTVHGDSPDKNTGVGCHALLQGIFPTQGWNPGLPHCRRILYQLSHQEAHGTAYSKAKIIISLFCS